jgi:hypothetical protein
MSATIDRSQPVTVTLTAEQWELVMRMLAKAPYEVVAPFISHIQQQCMRHAEAPMMQMRGNGELAEEATP